MALLHRHFEKFHSSIALDQSRVDRIKSAHQTLRRNVEADGPLSKVLKEVFLQGSYAQGTAVRPPDAGEFDVDVVLALNVEETDEFLGWPEKREPTRTLEWVANRLRTMPGYYGKVRRKGRCVRIQFAGEFHLDVVPAHAPSIPVNRVHVPNGSLNEWQLSNPKGYMEWCTRCNARTEGQFVRITKYLKWWRDHYVPQTARPKSVILQTMIGDALVTRHASDAHAIVHALTALASRSKPDFLFQQSPNIDNPSLAGEDLARNWSGESAAKFSDVAARAAAKAASALQTPDEYSSAFKWREVFGDRFPIGL